VNDHISEIGAAWSRVEFEARLREQGKATPEQVCGWVANRFSYQVAIPVKDAAVLSNCPDREVRRGWIQRILDHDGFDYGTTKDEGGIEAWIRLGIATGLTREEITDFRHVIPAPCNLQSMPT
jgi:pyrroloquinoline-quinone synthase